MAKAKRVRWECPNGLHPGVLGSTRPVRNATVRYCLPCSEDKGVLVERRAPALERQRAAKTETAARRRETKQEREREARARRYVVQVRDGEVDVRAEMDAMIRGSEELRMRLRETGESLRWRPALTVRSGAKTHVSGHCVWDGSAVTLTVGRGADVAEVREVLLHELCHAVTAWIVPNSGRRTRRGTRSRGRAWHGGAFQATLCRAARELFGTTVHPDDHREAYGLDRLILAQMREGGAA